MKLILTLCLLFIACAQRTKESETQASEAQNAVYELIDTVKQNDEIALKTFMATIKIKNTPLRDTTNFDSFKAENFLNTQEVSLLKLEEIYPNFYKEGHHYKAKASYKIELSGNFYTLVLTVLKGENEMESILKNYDFSEKILDSKVISYDEIAEGQSKIESKLKKNILTITTLFWADEKQVETATFIIEANGKIRPVSRRETLLDGVMQQLNLDYEKVNTDILVLKAMPNTPNETIVVIPEFVEKDKDYFTYNSYVVLVNNDTGKITHTYYESSETNNWLSDAVVLGVLTIDTAPYTLTENKRAFGVAVYYYNHSQPNPYSHKTISLFVKSGNILKKVLNQFDVMEYGGEWDTDCAGEFTRNENILIVTEHKTNGYFNILVQGKMTETLNYVAKNGDCESKKTITNTKTLLKFNGETYVAQ